MYIVVLKAKGKTVVAVTRKWQSAQRFVDAARIQSDDSVVWRIHDGVGWCDESEGAWREILTINSPMETDVFHFLP